MAHINDLAEAAQAVERLFGTLPRRGRELGREPLPKHQRREGRDAYEAAVAALRGATGAPRSVAEQWLNLVQTGIGSLRWESLTQYSGKLLELVQLVVAGNLEDRRYSTLTELATARSDAAQQLKRLRKESADSSALTGAIGESAKAARLREEEFRKAWGQES